MIVCLYFKEDMTCVGCKTKKSTYLCEDGEIRTLSEIALLRGFPLLECELPKYIKGKDLERVQERIKDIKFVYGEKIFE